MTAWMEPFLMCSQAHPVLARQGERAALNGEGPAGKRGLRAKPGHWGERGHQVCAEPSAVLGSERNSRTTGRLYAWERGGAVRGQAWGVIVSFRSMWWRHRNPPLGEATF